MILISMHKENRENNNETEYKRSDPIYFQVFFDVFVTSEYILTYIIIVCCYTPIGDVFTPLRDVLIMSIPLVTTSVVSQGNIPQCKIM